MDGEAMAILAYVLFKVASGTEREVAQKIIDFKEVLSADIVFGEYDVIGRLTTENLEALQDFVSDSIRTVPNVLVTSTMIISKEYEGKSFRPKNQ